ncbi:MAG: porin [Rhodospirillaceae bacterium]|nr:porin [Rhodospirillaceae bacterium]
MKKVLLGTSALLSVSFLAGTAVAYDGVKLSLGGFMRSYYGITVDDDGANEIGDDHNLDGVGTDAEIYFLGSVTLDNGVTVGARIELEAENEADQIDAAYAFFKGGFGDIRIGSQAGAAGNMYMLPPGSTANFGPYSPNTSGAVILPAFDPEGTLTRQDKSQKVAYYSPIWSGFSFGLSYTPNDDEEGYSGDDDADGTFHPFRESDSANHNVGLGLHYDYQGDGWGLALGGAAYWEGDVEDAGQNGGDADEQAGYNAGVNLSFGNLSFGTAFTFLDDGAGTKGDDVWMVGVGGAYEIDAWTFGLGWAHVNSENAAVDDDDNKLDRYALTGSYAMGPGIDIDAALAYTRVESADESDGADDYDAFEVSVGSSIKF